MDVRRGEGLRFRSGLTGGQRSFSSGCLREMEDDGDFCRPDMSLLALLRNEGAGSAGGGILRFVES